MCIQPGDDRCVKGEPVWSQSSHVAGLESLYSHRSQHAQGPISHGVDTDHHRPQIFPNESVHTGHRALLHTEGQLEAPMSRAASYSLRLLPAPLARACAAHCHCAFQWLSTVRWRVTEVPVHSGLHGSGVRF